MTGDTKGYQSVIWREGKWVLLRPHQESDLPQYQRWINDPENNVYLMRTAPVSWTDQTAWYERASKDNADLVSVAVCLRDGTLIGNMFLGINRVKQSAETGTLIGAKEHQGKGYATEAKMLILDYAFNWLGLRKVTSRILDFNKRSQRYAEKCGYRHMATIEQEYFRDGRWLDELHFVVFRDDWLPLWEEYAQEL